MEELSLTHSVIFTDVLWGELRSRVILYTLFEISKFLILVDNFFLLLTSISTGHPLIQPDWSGDTFQTRLFPLDMGLTFRLKNWVHLYSSQTFLPLLFFLPNYKRYIDDIQVMS